MALVVLMFMAVSIIATHMTQKPSNRSSGNPSRANTGKAGESTQPEARDIACEHRELDLFHPWAITSEEAARLALQCEAAALDTSRLITNSEGAGVSAQQSHFFSAHTKGFRGGYASSRHSISVAPIAGKGKEMQRDAWYSSMRDAA